MWILNFYNENEIEQDSNKKKNWNFSEEKF